MRWKKSDHFLSGLWTLTKSCERVRPICSVDSAARKSVKPLARGLLERLTRPFET